MTDQIFFSAVDMDNTEVVFQTPSRKGRLPPTTFMQQKTLVFEPRNVQGNSFVMNIISNIKAHYNCSPQRNSGTERVK